jgi:dipeptidyl aminopeptidase/acylaminoacyl peptidase
MKVFKSTAPVVGSVLLAILFVSAPVAAQVDIEPFLKKDSISSISISPTGEYFAIAVQRGDRTGLQIIRRADNKTSAGMDPGKNRHVEKIWWVNPDRILFNIAEKYFGEMDQPQSTGEILSLNAKNGQVDLLIGQRVAGEVLGTRIQKKKEEPIYAEMVDDLPNDDQSVIITVSPFGADPSRRAERMDVFSGERTFIVRAPVSSASFVTDNLGVVRFSWGSGSDNLSKLFYRSGDKADWELINDETASHIIEVPIGFSSDGKIAYLQSQHSQGPDSIVALDLTSKARSEVLHDANADPLEIIRSFDAGATPVGAVFMDGMPKTMFFDSASPEARLQHSLEAAFAGQSVRVTSTTKDGKLAVVWTGSSANPGDYYLFDTVAKTANLIFSQRKVIDPDSMAAVKPVEFKARDGLTIHAYLTLPKGSQGKNLPTVILPHGGPFGIFDQWTFDDDAQLLAKAGYAVLQVNYRGSGNFGRAFQHAGAREWGGKMQDDLTDATRWAIAQGISGADHICIYGASYGAYAALVGVAKEPGLYKCAVGYVGVYDLPTMVADDRSNSKSAATWTQDWVGEGDMLAANSPTNMAAKIKVPVLLVAGEEDKTAPIAHSKKMESALRKAGVPVETMYVAHEGHGFYDVANRRAYYVKLLDFLSRQLGGQTAK